MAKQLLNHKRHFILLLFFLLRSLSSCGNSNTPKKQPTNTEPKNINTSAGAIQNNTTPPSEKPENDIEEIKQVIDKLNQYSSNFGTNNKSNIPPVSLSQNTDTSKKKDPPISNTKIENYADVVQTKLCYHTGKKTPKLYQVKYKRYSSALRKWKTYTTYTFRKYEVEHKGNCGCLSTIPVILQASEKQIENMLDLMERTLHTSLTEAQKNVLNSNEYYQKLKSKDEYPILIAKTRETIRTLKAGTPKTLNKIEKDQLVEFIKHSILLIRFLQGTLDEQFWKGLDGHGESYSLLSRNNSQRSGSPALAGKNWWVDQMDISAVMNYLTTGMDQQSTDEKFGDIFYQEPITSTTQINLRIDQISKGFKPPLVYIIFSPGAYNYMVLEG